MSEPILTVANMNKKFGSTVALNDVSLTVYPGEIRGLIGENGSGKSTVTSIVAGMQECDSGAMTFQGQSWKPLSMIDALHKGIGMIVQESGTIPGITVAENIFLAESEKYKNKFGLINRKKMNADATRVMKNIGVNDVTGEMLMQKLDFQTRKLVEIAKVVEQAGAKAIAVHGRTRSQGYSGKADWNIIKQVKQAVTIPVIGNGDVRSCYDAKKMLDETGCDAVMIGRGVLGNPWLIKECIDYIENGKIPKKVSIDEKYNMILYHIHLLEQQKNEKVANLEMRTHIAYYLKGVPGASELKQKVFQTKNLTELKNLIKEYKEVNYES